MKNLEYRAYDMMDVAVDKDKRTIQGRAVVYNSMSNELRTMSGDKFKEVILRGALVESMEKNDVLAFREHNPEMLLGRKSAGTLSLEDREDGLYVKINVPETSYGNDTLISAERGDLKGFSFGFNNPKARSYIKNGDKIREISALNLREVSVVAAPAYPETTLTVVRSEDFIEEERKEEVSSEKPVLQKAEIEIPEQQTENKRDDKNKEIEMRFKFLSLTHK